ncbi:unspecific monooxygenase [Stackebrandtia albiflava]|uniref:Unspecific monooxygenase n=1 Tax=Stackebrandtia albiflava TaxID=406432 RepID=A0A562V3Z4_9ACTN|nr:cytochrome P450 [Stackebrandtia albiflava]TWJ12600.1 unspecific monooxygenase [Stackebrandtia albiflava]
MTVTCEPGYRESLPFDPFDPGFVRDPYPHYRRLHEKGPVGRAPGGWLYTVGYEESAALLRDPHVHTGGMRQLTTDVRRLVRHTPALSFLFMNPPQHDRLRRVVTGAFTPRVVARLEARVRHHVTDLLAPLHGRVELMSEFAFRLPLAVIGELLGLPEGDHAMLRGWTEALARGLDPDVLLTPTQRDARDDARESAFAYFRELARFRRRRPADDLISALAADPELPVARLPGLCTLIMSAGHETVANLIGNGYLALLRHPGQLRLLTERPDVVGNAVEELLRFDGPAQVAFRVPQRDTVVGDLIAPAGEPVTVMIAAANHDPRRVPEPHRLDIRRAARPTLGFGYGPHFCVGAALARMEGRIAFTALARMGGRLAGPVTYRENFVLRGLTALPVEFDRRDLGRAGAPGRRLHLPAPGDRRRIRPPARLG